MKCQILFSGKNKKNNIILSSAENAQRVVKVKEPISRSNTNTSFVGSFSSNLSENKRPMSHDSLT